jgi:hypothetical protein
MGLIVAATWSWTICGCAKGAYSSSDGDLVEPVVNTGQGGEVANIYRLR